MMQNIRFISRLFALVLWTLVLYPMLLTGKFILSPFKTARRKWRSSIVGLWSRGIAAIVGMRIKVVGTPPKPPFFLVSNHLSYLDIILLFTRIDVIFVAKGDLQHWPVFNLLVKVADTIFIDREQRKDVVRVNALIQEAMETGENIIVFPEGTSTKGDGILHFKPSLFEYPARNRFPVSVASVHYRREAPEPHAYLSVCWWGDMEFAPHFLDLLKLSKFHATIYFGDQKTTSGDRKTLARESRELIHELFIPVTEGLAAEETDGKLDIPVQEEAVRR